MIQVYYIQYRIIILMAKAFNTLKNFTKLLIW